MHVVEGFSVAKSPDRANEDAIHLGDEFVAVFDGATAKDPTLDPSPGSVAVSALSAALASLRGGSMRVVVEELTRALRGLSMPQGSDTSASALIFSRQFQEVWVIGDGWVILEDGKHGFHHQAERRAAMARSALLRALLTDGRTLAQLRTPPDPGRAMIHPLLQAERFLRNVDRPGPLYWGSLDGTHVPDRHVIRIAVPPGVHRIVLASDGYPDVGLTLSESEEMLRRRIARDPLMIGSRPQTKGVMLGENSFDDRTWVEVAV